MEDSAHSAVPLFPLPNVVLFPRAVLPLHIFEHRYQQMTADALAGNRRIAMALLRPGWEKLYHARPAVEPVVCLGTILTHEQLPDGKFNFLLQGLSRARILNELDQPRRIYRLANLQPLESREEIDLNEQRRRLLEMFGSGVFASTPLAAQFRKMLDSAMPIGEVADLIAFNFFEDVLQQSLLVECDVPKRVERVIAELDSLRPQFRPPRSGLPRPGVN
ncbi:MAG TPA: LON peptidase substrate-binding domain-containing protein [Tepidisphaeraceae bacterium]